MLPTSDTNRYIQVSAGSAHVRILKKTVDEMDVPIVERMTLKKLGKMTARQVKLWKMKAIEAINNVPEESRQMTVDTYFTQPSPATSYHRRHTHEAPSPVKKAGGLFGRSADAGLHARQVGWKEETHGLAQARASSQQEGCRQALAGRVPRVNHRAFSRENMYMSCGDTLS